MVARAGQFTMQIPYKYTVVPPAKPVGLAHARVAALTIQLKWNPQLKWNFHFSQQLKWNFHFSKQDRPSVVMVARSFKKSFTKLALKLSYQKTLLLRKKLCFRGKNFAPARPTSPPCDQLLPCPTNSAPARPTLPLFSVYKIYPFMYSLNIQLCL
jgi:hypothetical protein